eukprot:gene6377-1137_t
MLLVDPSTAGALVLSQYILPALTSAEGQFDHGCQYMVARTPEFDATLQQWQAAGAVAKWKGHFMEWRNHDMQEAPGTPRWVGCPTMSAVTRHLAKGLNIVASTRVTSMERRPTGWSLGDDGSKQYGPYDWVVLTCPGPQAAALVPYGSQAHDLACRMFYNPCWTLMATCNSPETVNFDSVTLHDHETLGWVARDSSKPQRPHGERWVVFASPWWSAVNVDEPASVVAETLAKAAADTLGLQLASMDTHRWLYAQTANPSSARGSAPQPTGSEHYE